MINPNKINDEWLEKFYSPANIITSDEPIKASKLILSLVKTIANNTIK